MDFSLFPFNFSLFPFNFSLFSFPFSLPLTAAKNTEADEAYIPLRNICLIDLSLNAFKKAPHCGRAEYILLISFISIKNGCYQCFAFGYFLNHPSQRRRITPKKASPNMPPLILLTPSRRFTNITGTSFIL